MSKENSTHIFPDQAREVIAFKARQLLQRRDFRTSDQVDLEQAIWQHVCEQIGRFDPAKASLPTYFNHLVETATAKLVRAQERKKRVLELSMHSLEGRPSTASKQNDPLSEGVSPADQGRRRGLTAPDPVTAADRRDAIAVALSRMPERLKAIACALMHRKRAEVAREFNLPFNTLKRLCREIGEHLERAGLEKCRF
jgi:hypothetical protein